MKKILFKNENNTVSLMSFDQSLTIEQALADIPSGAQHIIVDESQLPSDQDLIDFFDALSVDFSNGNIGFDITEAREITKQRLRRERVPLFEKNDMAIRDAMIDKDFEKLTLAVEERNRLRDVTNQTDTLESLDDLRNLHP